MTDTLDMLEGEVWRLHPIGVYVSNLGRVYVSKTKGHQAHYTYGCLNGRGYLLIGWNYKLYYVHRLVAECFLDNPNNYKEIDHINRDKTDNKAENLRWTTRSMQQYNRDFSNHKNNAKSKKVLMIDKDTNEIIKVWESVNECGRNGFHHGAVSACCNGKYTEKSPNIYKGYIWKYT